MKAVKAIRNRESNNRSLEEVALRYKLLQSQAEQIDRVMQSLRTELERAVKTEGNGRVLILETFKLCLSSCQREVFSLKSARKTIPDNVLKPYVSVTNYTRLAVSERGHSKKIAA